MSTPEVLRESPPSGWSRFVKGLLTLVATGVAVGGGLALLNRTGIYETQIGAGLSNYASRGWNALFGPGATETPRPGPGYARGPGNETPGAVKGQMDVKQAQDAKISQNASQVQAKLGEDAPQIQLKSGTDDAAIRKAFEAQSKGNGIPPPVAGN